MRVMRNDTYYIIIKSAGFDLPLTKEKHEMMEIIMFYLRPGIDKDGNVKMFKKYNYLEKDGYGINIKEWVENLAKILDIKVVFIKNDLWKNGADVDDSFWAFPPNKTKNIKRKKKTYYINIKKEYRRDKDGNIHDEYAVMFNNFKKYKDEHIKILTKERRYFKRFLKDLQWIFNIKIKKISRWRKFLKKVNTLYNKIIL